MWGETTEQAAIDTVLAALDRGLTLIDTAPAYGFGRAETLVGQALDEYGRRDEVVLAPEGARLERRRTVPPGHL